MTTSPASTNHPRSPSGAPRLGDGVLHFLASLGQRSEAELYLRLFQGLPRHEFALLVPTAEVLQKSAGTLAEQLSFLRELGLVPTMLLGALDLVDQTTVDQFLGALSDARLSAKTIQVRSGMSADDLCGAMRDEDVLVLKMASASDEILAEVSAALSPRKTLLLRWSGGLGPHQADVLELTPGHFLQRSTSGIGVINLRSDAAELANAQLLSSDDALFLSRAQRILEERPRLHPRATVAVASPLSILRELFTVSGEGTLIKLGAAIDTHSGYEGLDRGRLENLLTESFGRDVVPAFWERTPLALHLEADYRGVALVEEGLEGAFLSKFAVLPIAQGEGLGQDLWWALFKSSPSLYWRSRPTNPINDWYRTVCDGMHRTERWTVFWRGIPASALPFVIEDAVRRPEDFVR